MAIPPERTGQHMNSSVHSLQLGAYPGSLEHQCLYNSVHSDMDYSKERGSRKESGNGILGLLPRSTHGSLEISERF